MFKRKSFRVGLMAVMALAVFCTAAAAQNRDSKSNWKLYYKSCKPCSDPWVGELYTNIWGACPSETGGQNDFCNVKLYNNGSWSSKAQLETFVRGKYTGSSGRGNVYIFTKPENVAGLGHIGWGFQLSDGSFFAGSTENYFKGNPLAAYWINAGADNDFWSKRFMSEAAMFAELKRLGYSKYKSIGWPNPNIAGGKRRAEEVMQKGFQGISNNCLNHTYQVLEGLGIPAAPLGQPNNGMPWLQTNPTPNGWYNEWFKSVTGAGKSL